MASSHLGLALALPQTPKTASITTATATVALSETKPTYHLPATFPSTLTYVSTGIRTVTLGSTPSAGRPTVVSVAWTTSTIDPWPALPTDFPLTHVVTLVGVEDDLDAKNRGTGATATARRTSTSYTTFVLWKPVDAVEFLTGEPGCEAGGEEEDGPGPARACEEMGFQTGCRRQCPVFSGLYWCSKYGNGQVKEAQLSSPGLAEGGVTGRVCWAEGHEIMQLMEPCLEGDLQPGCISDEGNGNG